MKISFLLFLLPLGAMAQWNNTGDNSTTGSVIASSLTTTANYGINLAPSNADAVIRRSNPGSLMISSNGGESEIRLNYNYGGGSGGMSIYDGGTINHGNLKVNSSGHLVLSSSGGFVGIGKNDPKNALAVFRQSDADMVLSRTHPQALLPFGSASTHYIRTGQLSTGMMEGFF